MSQRGALGPREVPIVCRLPEMCPCQSVPFCYCWPHYRSGVLGYNTKTKQFGNFKQGTGLLTFGTISAFLPNGKLSKDDFFHLQKGAAMI